MESGNNSTQNIMKDISELNHSIDLSTGYHGHKEPKECKTMKMLRKVVNWLTRKTVIYFVIFCILNAYAIWATYHFLENTDDLSWESFKDSMHHGYGLFVILHVFYLFSLAYYIFLKPYILPIINTYIWTPTAYLLGKIRFGQALFFIVVFAGMLVYLIFDARENTRRLVPLLGLTIFICIGFIFSANHKAIQWRTVAWGLLLQFAFGFLTIRWTIGRSILQTFSDHVNTFMDYGIQAAVFTYGEFLVTDQQVFAFNALSVIFFIGFVVNILYYYGLMQRFVNMLGECLQYILGTSICESVNSVAVAFVGMSEGPMMLRPYLKHLTDSELHAMLLAGFASVSGSTFAAYVSYGARAQDLITSSIMSAPAALCFSKLLYPETEEVKIKREDVHMIKIEYTSALDAASKGATDAFHLIAAIISGVTATLAFVYFINGVLTWFGILVGFTDESNMWTLELIAGKIFIPVAWVMGVEWSECEDVARLIGLKTMVNEFVAFSRMGAMNLSTRSKVIATYSICGFANPGSIGIMLSTMSALVPEKKESVTRMIFGACAGGAIVCFMTACIASILMTDSSLEEDISNRTSLIFNSTMLTV